MICKNHGEVSQFDPRKTDVQAYICVSLCILRTVLVFTLSSFEVSRIIIMLHFIQVIFVVIDYMMFLD